VHPLLPEGDGDRAVDVRIQDRDPCTLVTTPFLGGPYQCGADSSPPLSLRSSKRVDKQPCASQIGEHLAIGVVHRWLDVGAELTDHFSVQLRNKPEPSPGPASRTFTVRAP
jgi:hypothetical protein